MSKLKLRFYGERAAEVNGQPLTARYLGVCIDIEGVDWRDTSWLNSVWLAWKLDGTYPKGYRVGMPTETLESYRMMRLCKRIGLMLAQM